MSHSVQDLLRKINYIEADIEIQKQILFSTPRDKEQELEKIITVIAQKKEMISDLRQEIKKLDPKEYENIIRFEKASDAFKQLATEKKFIAIENMTNDRECFLSLKDNTTIPCLVKACEENGDFTIITLNAEIKHYEAKDVNEKKPGLVL